MPELAEVRSNTEDEVMYDKSWGYLGKPPASVLNGTNPKMDLFRQYQTEAAKAQKMANSKARTVKLAELKAKFTRDFPPEGSNE